MRANQLTVALALTAALGGAGYGLYRLGMHQAMQMPSATAPPAQAAAGADAAGGASAGRSDADTADRIGPKTGKRVLYWHDPMVPGQKFDRPGKSPFMDMELVPVYAEDGNDDGAVAVSPRVQQSLGVRTAQVTAGRLARSVQAVGSVAYNERDVALVQARSAGFVERLHVRATLDPVRKGQPLVDLYVPDWVAAQEEYLSARRMQGTRLEALVDGARQRMRLAGMTEDQIRLVESSGTVQPRLTVMAPIGGVVTELAAREGMAVMAGATLFRINGVSPVWVNAEVPESLAAQVRPGTVVQARAAALPNTTFKGKVSALLPEVDTATRTIKARIELANPGGKLVPGMFTTVDFAPATGAAALIVPTEAVIRTGKRDVVILAEEGGRFRPVEVEVGLESDGQTQIKRGLEPGQRVVVSGQFLLDSEASLKATINRMGEDSAGRDEPPAEPGAGGPGKTASDAHRGTGRIEAIDKDGVTISHGPIASLQWGAMTMGFQIAPGALPAGAKVGDSVRFELRPLADGAYKVTSMSIDTGSAK